jgi:hypothetical protein
MPYARYPYKRYSHSSHYVRGSGKYTLPKDFLPRGWFAKQGARAGRFIGSKSPIAPAIFAQAGSELGRYAGNYLSRVTGTGSYTLSKSRRTKKPARYYKRAAYSNGVRFGGSSIRVKHREMIAQINSVAGFQSQTFSLNPGLDTVFPWLSQTAKNYQQYIFHGLIFEFKSTSSDAISSTTNLGLGQTGLATNYDPSARPFQSMIEALNTDHANISKPSDNVMHAIECKKRDTPVYVKYVRTGPIVNRDLRNYDHGLTQFISNMPATYDGLGQLWVTYDVTFLKPQMKSQIGSALNSDRFQIVSPNNTNMLGTANQYRAHPLNNLGVELDLATSAIVFPASLSEGTFLLVYTVRGGLANVTPGNFSTTNLNLLQVWNSDADTIWNPGGNSITRTTISVVVRINGNDSRLEFGTGWTIPTAVQSCDLIVTQVNGDVFTAPSGGYTSVIT